MADVFTGMVSFLTGNFPFSPELQAFWMALQGAMSVRNGPNKDRKMAWFHAFLLSVVCGYGGAAFTPLWMGRPTTMLSNDLNFAACIVTFFIANYIPFDLGYKLGNTLPITMVTVIFSQLFRTMGVVRFTSIAFEAFKDTPSAYYPIPVFGPIVYATILGNMSPFFLKGFHGHLENGMPWAFQNGLFCATLYHFFVHDQTGPIGTYLRSVIHSMPALQFGLDDNTFAIVFVSAFMQIVGLLQLPQFLGPRFSPFTVIPSIVGAMLKPAPKAKVNSTKKEVPSATETKTNGNAKRNPKTEAAVTTKGKPTVNGKKANGNAPSKDVNTAAAVNGEKKKRIRKKKDKEL